MVWQKMKSFLEIIMYLHLEIQVVVDRPIVQQKYCLLHQGKVVFFRDDIIEEDIIRK